MSKEIPSPSPSIKSSDNSRGQLDRMSDHAPLISQVFDDARNSINILVDHINHPDYQGLYKAAEYGSSIFVPRENLESEEKTLLHSLMKPKSEYCLINIDSYGTITSEFPLELFRQHLDHLSQENAHISQENTSILAQLPEGMQETSEYIARRGLSEYRRSRTTNEINDVASLWEHLKPGSNDVIIIGDTHDRSAILDNTVKLINESGSQFKYCFLEMVHSLRQPILDEWMRGETDDSSLEQLLNESSARGDQNISLLKVLKDNEIIPIAINVHLHTETQFERGGHWRDVREDGADIIFAQYIKNTLSQEASAVRTPSLCFVGNKHLSGLQEILSETGIQSSTINIEPVVQNHASCIVRRNGAVSLYVPTKEDGTTLPWEKIRLKEILPARRRSRTSSHGSSTEDITLEGLEENPTKARKLTAKTLEMSSAKPFSIMSNEDILTELQQRLGDEIDGDRLIFENFAGRMKENEILSDDKMHDLLNALNSSHTEIREDIATDIEISNHEFITTLNNNLRSLNIIFNTTDTVIQQDNYLPIIESTIETIQSKGSISRKEFKIIFEDQCQKDHTIKPKESATTHAI